MHVFVWSKVNEELRTMNNNYNGNTMSDLIRHNHRQAYNCAQANIDKNI